MPKEQYRPELEYYFEHALFNPKEGKRIVITKSRGGNMVFSLFDGSKESLTVYISKRSEFSQLWDFLKNNFRGSEQTVRSENE